MDSSSKRLLSTNDTSPEGTPTHAAHTEGDGGTPSGDTAQVQVEITVEGDPSDQKESEEQVSSSRKKSVQMSDNQSNTLGPPLISRGSSRRRKPSLRFKSSTGAGERLTKKDSQTKFVLPPAEPTQWRKDSACGILFSHDRQSRRVRRKPSLMSLPTSQCSEFGTTRHYSHIYQFDEASLDSTAMKRDSIVSCTSVHGTILKPSIMAQGEMFSECQRQKQWLMAIHASDPDETLPMLKRPVFLVDDGGKITMQTVEMSVPCLALLSIILNDFCGIFSSKDIR